MLSFSVIGEGVVRSDGDKVKILMIDKRERLVVPSRQDIPIQTGILVYTGTGYKFLTSSGIAIAVPKEVVPTSISV